MSTVAGGTLTGTSGNDTLDIIHEISGLGLNTRQTIYSALYGLEGNDELSNRLFIYGTDSERKNKILIDGGAGNDTISNYGESSTLLGGEGNDKINNYGKKNSISGGEGNDSINNHASHVKIYGGKAIRQSRLATATIQSTITLLTSKFTAAKATIPSATTTAIM